MPSALPVGGAVPYDAYSSDHLHDQTPSSHPPQQQQQATAGGGGGGSPWYDVSDGAVTPPGDSSSSSHRDEFVSHMPHTSVSSTKRRPLGCRLAVIIFTHLLLLASLAVAAYFLRCAIRCFRYGNVTLLSCTMKYELTSLLPTKKKSGENDATCK